MNRTRRNGYSATLPTDYTDDELEFMKAIDRYKREHRRPFPTWAEVLEVLVALGYTKGRQPLDAKLGAAGRERAAGTSLHRPPVFGASMSKYQNVMSKNPPRLVVQYHRGETRDKDNYTWGFGGGMPIAHLIGYITRVQAELAFRNPDPCDDCACIICYNQTTGKMDWFVDSSIPVDPLVGTLELVKQSLVDAQLMSMAQAAMAKADTGLIDAAGKPILKGK